MYAGIRDSIRDTAITMDSVADVPDELVEMCGEASFVLIGEAWHA